MYNICLLNLESPKEAAVKWPTGTNFSSRPFYVSGWIDTCSPPAVTKRAIRWHYEKDVSFVNFIFKHNISLRHNVLLLSIHLCLFHAFSTFFRVQIGHHHHHYCYRYKLYHHHLVCCVLDIASQPAWREAYLKIPLQWKQGLFLKPEKQEMLFSKIRVEKGLCGVFSEWSRVSTLRALNPGGNFNIYVVKSLTRCLENGPLQPRVSSSIPRISSASPPNHELPIRRQLHLAFPLAESSTQMVLFIFFLPEDEEDQAALSVDLGRGWAGHAVGF